MKSGVSGVPKVKNIKMNLVKIKIAMTLKTDSSLLLFIMKMD
jgi:hypothetical protein